MIKSVSQIDSKITACCRFMQPIGKKLVTAMDWQQEPIGIKLALEFFVKIIYATSLDYLLLQLLYFYILQQQSLNKVSFY